MDALRVLVGTRLQERESVKTVHALPIGGSQGADVSAILDAIEAELGTRLFASQPCRDTTDLEALSPADRRTGKYPRERRIQQLLAALDTHELLLSVEESDGGLALARIVAASRWLRDHVPARWLLRVTARQAADRALEPVLHGAVELHRDEPTSERSAPRDHDPGAASITGQPHPRSRGEQTLARLLASDTELRGLFRFNEPVAVAGGRLHRVDLLWPAGRLVVEVDGYYWHGSAIAFRADRHRDYELCCAGYRVLRLTDEEILEDEHIALDKIRDVVKLLQGGRAR